MWKVLPKITIMSKLFDLIKVKTKKPTKFYATAHTI